MVTKSTFEGAIAAIEFTLPTFKGELKWARAVAAAWEINEPVSHKKPLPEGAAAFVAVHMAAQGHPRLAAGLVVQQACGLRPSELLGMRRTDLILPEDAGRDVPGAYAVLGLGMRAGTKAKRPQTVLLDSPIKVALLRWLRATMNDVNDSLIGYTYEQYRRVLTKVVDSLELSHIGWTPRSPRAGFTSDTIASGAGFNKTREMGRWVSEQSLRTYIDITASSSILVSFRLRALTGAMGYACAHLLSLFPGASQYARVAPLNAAHHGSEGLEVGQGPGHVSATERS